MTEFYFRLKVNLALLTALSLGYPQGSNTRFATGRFSDYSRENGPQRITGRADIQERPWQNAERRNAKTPPKGGASRKASSEISQFITITHELRDFPEIRQV